jgi:hypothetical protein
MKFTILTEGFKTFFKLSYIDFDTNTSLWRLQRVHDAFGLTSSTRVTTMLFLPQISRAPSVHIPTNLIQTWPFVLT